MQRVPMAYMFFSFIMLRKNYDQRVSLCSNMPVLTVHEDYQIILKESSKTSKIRLNKPEDCSIQQIACIQESSAKRYLIKG
jgi:hypothetical protein